MKNLGFIALLILAIIQVSCDRVPVAYKDIPDLDSTYYPGVWGDYVLNEWPTFEQNTNAQRNVLIEKYTGHQCVPCVSAAAVVREVAESHPHHVFYVSLHAGPGGMTTFQNYNPQASSFYTNHTNSIGLAYGAYFLTGYGFIGNPGITVNKEVFGGSNTDMFAPATSTQGRVEQLLTENDLRYNIQSVCNYFPQTQGGYLHVCVDKIQAENPDVDLIVYVVQDSLRDWQKLPAGQEDPQFKHTKKHLGNIDNQVWGQRLTFSDNNKAYKDYSFAKPQGIEAENLHFLIFVSDATTKKVYQVIKQKLVD